LRRILIADDSAPTRYALCRLIESHEGWEVCGEAADGADAVEQAARLVPDLVVLDLTMPNMNGFQAAEAIRASKPEIPLLLFTLHTVDPAMVAKAQSVGFNGAISKSSFESIVRGIETVLGGAPFFGAEPAAS
jgi:DNA-binding NarL/FixJ family response regulator